MTVRKIDGVTLDADTVDNIEVPESKFIYKSADQIVTNSTIKVNDIHLVLPVSANEVWSVFLHLRHLIAVPAKLSLKWEVPALSSLKWIRHNEIGSSSGTTVLTELTEADSVVLDGSASNTASLYWGIYTGGANAGTLQLTWAQESAAPSEDKLLKGSHLIARKLL